MKKFTIILLTIFITACSTVDLNTPSQTTFVSGSSMVSILDKYGPPFSVEETESDVVMIYYVRKTKDNGMVWVPVVNLVATGVNHRVERFTLTFNSQDLLVNQASETAKGFTSLYAMGQNEGMMGDGGLRDNLEYRNLGKFLAKRGIFFDQQLWKLQNVSNNYFQKYKQDK